MEVSKEMQQLIDLMKQHFKEEAHMTVESVTFGSVKDLVLIKNKETGKYGVIFPHDWEKNNLKEGVDVEKLAASLEFVCGYRMKDLLED